MYLGAVTKTQALASVIDDTTVQVAGDVDQQVDCASFFFDSWCLLGHPLSNPYPEWKH